MPQCSQGTRVLREEDQDTNDLEKCLRYIHSEWRTTMDDCVLVAGGCGGRFDHVCNKCRPAFIIPTQEMANINASLKYLRLVPSSSTRASAPLCQSAVLSVAPQEPPPTFCTPGHLILFSRSSLITILLPSEEVRCQSVSKNDCGCSLRRGKYMK